MSQAAVGQRSAQSPQWTQTSSSLTITRPVCGSPPDTKIAWVVLVAGTVSRWRSSGSSPLAVMVRQLVGQTSTQASHSMQRLSVNAVCTSQFRQRSTSRMVCSWSKPISTSIDSCLKRSLRSTCFIFARWAVL